MCQHDQDENRIPMNRRAVLKAGAATFAAAAVLPVFADDGEKDKYAPPAEPALPPSNMKLNLTADGSRGDRSSDRFSESEGRDLGRRW